MCRPGSSGADGRVTPTNVAIELGRAQEARLSAITSRLDVRVERLAQAAVRELLSGPEAAFDEVAKQLLRKNEELYKRLVSFRLDGMDPSKRFRYDRHGLHWP